MIPLVPHELGQLLVAARAAADAPESDDDLPNPHLPQQPDAASGFGAVQRLREIDQRLDVLRAELSPLQERTRRAVESGDAVALVDLAERMRPLQTEIAELLAERGQCEEEARRGLLGKGERIVRTYQAQIATLESRQRALALRLVSALQDASAALRELDTLPSEAQAAMDAALRAWQQTEREYAPASVNGPFFPPPRLPDVDWRAIGEALRPVADHPRLMTFILGAVVIPDATMDAWRQRQLAERARPRVQ